jgi:hypothetical protein
LLGARRACHGDRVMARALLHSCLLVLAVTGRAGATETRACRTLQGPCAFLDTFDVLLPRDPAAAPTLVANFGLLARDAGATLRYACEGPLGGLAVGARMSPDGTVLVPGDKGVTTHRPACGPTLATGDVSGRSMLAVIIDPDNGRHVWALGREGPTLYLSEDGGASFTRAAVFSEAQRVLQIEVAPSRPQVLYGAGDRSGDSRLLLMRSGDGGRSFAEVDPAGAPTGLPLELLGVAPDDADTLYVAIKGSDEREAVVRSRDGGRSWTRILTLPVNQMLGGFTFGASAKNVYVAARSTVFDTNAPPAHLFVSADGGDTFAAPIPSRPADGPRFRCLGFRAGLLYACAGGTPNGDTFLLGSSSDGGHTWMPLMTVEQLAGPEPCMRDVCASTSAWLCDFYDLCAAADGGRPDATPVDAGPKGPGGAPSTNGCGCALGGGSRANLGAMVFVLVAGLLQVQWRRRTGPTTLER